MFCEIVSEPGIVYINRIPNFRQQQNFLEPAGVIIRL